MEDQAVFFAFFFRAACIFLPQARAAALPALSATPTTDDEDFFLRLRTVLVADPLELLRLRVLVAPLDAERVPRAVAI
jgi:hypothetical protein